MPDLKQVSQARESARPVGAGAGFMRKARQRLPAALLALLAIAASDEDAALAALNGLIQSLGPFAGRISSELPPDLDPEVANAYAFEGGFTGTAADPAEGFNSGNLRERGGSIDVPTGARPSPLFDAQPFTQGLVLLEEFGLLPMPSEADVTSGSEFPRPPDAESGPAGDAVSRFLQEPLYPHPTRLANEEQLNSWQPDIEAFLERPLAAPPVEGRPPGEDWAHQRWEEFLPEVYVKTAQLSARTNDGLRDVLQSHHYRSGEFAPGGLYHNPTGLPGSEGTTRGLEARFHPNFPPQGPNVLWTFDGTFPPKLLMSRYGQPVLLRHYNALPIDPAANSGFGLHTITTHEHNGHSPAESDGYTQAFFFPGQFYDYHWPMVLAGHDTINTAAADPRAGAPDGAGGISAIPGDYRETMSTHWFHDHMLDFTAQNVYKGNAAMMNYYSSLDRGNEGLEDGVNLRLPSGTALDSGNRDYDVNLIIADKAWDDEGQLFFNIFNNDGFLGDQLLTNWLWKPYLDVRARRYRLRLLNGSVSRYFTYALVARVEGSGGELAGPPGSEISYNRVPFHLVANDGNIMEHAVAFDGSATAAGLPARRGIAPTQGIAERYDIIVDFAPFAPGAKLYLLNLLEHRDGGGPNEEIPLADVLSGAYAPEVDRDRNRTDPCVAAFLEFRVQAYSGKDLSMDPAEFVAGKRTMIPLPKFSQAELEGALHRTFEFGRSAGTDQAPWTIKTDGGAGFVMDPRRLSAAPAQGHLEIWHLLNGGGGWSHPVHIHFEEGQILRRGGKEPPEWERWARKDVYRLGPMPDSTDSVDVVLRFREFLGTFMEHCHNTQHEDHSMLLRWDVEHPGQLRVMPTPMPSWDGVGYVSSFALPTFRVGDKDARAAQNPDFGRLTQ